MQQLTFLEYALLMQIKNGTWNGIAFTAIVAGLYLKGLISHSWQYVISGKRYNYRGNTYTL